MVKKLHLNEERQDKGDRELIQQLNCYERRLRAWRLENQQQQQDIRAYFASKIDSLYRGFTVPRSTVLAVLRSTQLSQDLEIECRRKNIFQQTVANLAASLAMLRWQPKLNSHFNPFPTT
ncbi:uncharacterized protein CIMG_12991 [Coccidioides immitis RS]|uniref:Uncharacterized protein n=1 Tax=Coccidioides immitis (strain RS) TaxID=246410 RepID=A0A0D8JT52_COCIM|nr:uncharacterized protein CIMG_12991 [Coccidioides immitis RS]KJF60472.1 hypothetical protein CIMG_12991 [Coccidioides immitis RS]